MAQQQTARTAAKSAAAVRNRPTSQANTLFTLGLVAVAGGYYWVRFKSAKDTTGTGAALPSHLPLAARVDQAKLRALLADDAPAGGARDGGPSTVSPETLK